MKSVSVIILTKKVLVAFSVTAFLMLTCMNAIAQDGNAGINEAIPK